MLGTFSGAPLPLRSIYGGSCLGEHLPNLSFSSLPLPLSPTPFLSVRGFPFPLPLFPYPLPGKGQPLTERKGVRERERGREEKRVGRCSPKQKLTTTPVVTNEPLILSSNQHWSPVVLPLSQLSSAFTSNSRQIFTNKLKLNDSAAVSMGQSESLNVMEWTPVSIAPPL